MVAHLQNFIDQTNDNGAVLLKYIASYTGHVSVNHYELSFSEQEDVHQEIAIKLLCQGQKIADKFTKRWLYVMVRNQCIDQLRKQGRQLATQASSSHSVDDVCAPAPTVDEGGDVSLMHSLNCLDTIFSYIEAQPTGEADLAIYTQYAFGLSHNEIAERSNRTANTIARRLSILRGRLKDLKRELC